MQIKAATTLDANGKTDAFVLFCSPTKKLLVAPDAALQKSAREAIRDGEFKGNTGQSLFVRGGAKGRRLLVVGVGDKPTADGYRNAAANAVKELDLRGVASATMLTPDGMDSAIGEGAGLGMYRFEQFKTGAKKATLRQLTLAPETGTRPHMSKVVREARAVSAAVGFARDLGNQPGNVCTPTHLAREARKLANEKLKVRIYNRADIKRMKMGAFSAVAAGSTNEPRLIEFHYKGAGARAKTIAIVGKGVTFDTGGISIKPPGGMEDMKFDMGGGAAVFGLMHLVAALKPKVNIHALVPAADNMPDGSAYRPGDILTSRSGKTIEVISTDAEGRLLLCDAITYAVEKKPDCIIDLATLTGACVVALADTACGLFSNNDALTAALKAAGSETGEEAWHMPLFPAFTEMMKGTYADLRNGGGRWGGACTAAAFLQEFVGDCAWAHLDIAGVGWAESHKGYKSKGATGYGVRLLWEFLKTR
jgi:leucyl aminopeptidase